MWLRFFSVLCLFGAIVGGATFYFPITGLGVSQLTLSSILFFPMMEANVISP